MKIKRQSLNEEYNTTVDWINDFAKNLEKNADYLNNLRSIMKKRQDFPSIEEKMADLKERVGFDLIKAVNNDENNVKSAGCGCGTCSKCGAKKNKKILIEDLRNILQYIASFSADRPEAGYGSVITHCREHPKLGFDKIEGKIDHGKFKTMVESILKKHKIDPEAVEYTPEADMPSSYEDDVADYYSHAIG